MHKIDKKEYKYAINEQWDCLAKIEVFMVY